MAMAKESGGGQSMKSAESGGGYGVAKIGK